MSIGDFAGPLEFNTLFEAVRLYSIRLT